MRIFEKISFNLNKIKFKENYGFLTALLDERGIAYPDLGFHFSHAHTTMEKIKSKFPALTHYCEEKVFSSTLSGGTIYLAEEEKSDFITLLGKIPHSYNFGFMTVVLDNIDWYGNGASEGVNLVPPTKTSGVFNSRYYSNHIRFRKEFDYGNKYNFVTFCIERFGDDKQLEPLPLAFEEIISSLGKPYHRELQCVDDKPERERCTAAALKIRSRFERGQFTHRFNEFECSTPPKGPTFESAVDDITPTKGISPKKAITAPARRHGYKFVSYCQGEYDYRRSNGNNHTFEVKFVVPPFTPFLFADIRVFGYNFNVPLPGGDEIKPRTDDNIAKYAEICFGIADELEEALADELFCTFGRTPDWYK